MPFVLRSKDGQVVSLHREAVPGAQPIAADHADVRAFLGGDDPESEFDALDAGLVRVVEDLIDVLIARHVIRITDLPAQAQRKLSERKRARDRMKAHALRLFGATGAIPLSYVDEVVHTDLDTR